MGRLRCATLPELLACTLLALAFFWRVWAPNPADRMMVGLAAGDFQRQFYPYRVFVARSWGSAQPPLVNPHQYAGAPAWADPQQGVLYPWRVLQVPLAVGGRTLPLWAVELEAIAHVALAAWFCMLLARRLGASRPAAILSGVAFGFGGYLTGYPVDQLAVLETAAWVPAMLWALTAAVDAGASKPRSSLRWAIVAALATAMSIVAGHPQTAAYGLAAALVWFAWRTQRTRMSPRLAAGVGAAWLIGAGGLSAAQWLPALELSGHVGERFDPAQALIGLPVGDLVQVVTPSVVSAYSPLYVGIVTLILGLWAAAKVRAARFWIGLAVLGWVFALGGNGPAYPLLLRLVPAAGVFRHQERLAILVSLGLAVAAGLALDRLMRGPKAQTRGTALLAVSLSGLTALGAAVGIVRPSLFGALLGRLVSLDPVTATDTLAGAMADELAFTALLSGVAAVVLALRMIGRLGARPMGFALVALLVFDLASRASWLPLAPRSDPFQPDSAVSALLPKAREGRVSSEGRLPGGPNAATVFELYDTTGDSPMQLARIRRLVEEFPEVVWWRLLGVRYVLTNRDFDEGSPVTLLGRTDDAGLYESQLPAVPAWAARNVVYEPLEWRPSPDFDPQETVVLESAGTESGASNPSGATEPGSGRAEVRLTGLTNSSADIEAKLPWDGWLVFSTAYHPGWQATAEGPSGTVLRPDVAVAYGGLPAIPLPAGSWLVKWTYRENAVIVGLIVSTITAICGALLWRRTRGGKA